jgi:hypothetical protein
MGLLADIKKVRDVNKGVKHAKALARKKKVMKTREAKTEGNLNVNLRKQLEIVENPR